MKQFKFSASFITRVQKYFGQEMMSPRLQEYLDEGDHVRVAEFLRGSREWRDVDQAIEAILTKSFIEVKAIAGREHRLKEIEDRCAMEVCDHCGVENSELVRG